MECTVVSQSTVYRRKNFQDADFRGSAPFLGQTAGNFRVTLPQTPVI